MAERKPDEPTDWTGAEPACRVGVSTSRARVSASRVRPRVRDRRHRARVNRVGTRASRIEAESASPDIMHYNIFQVMDAEGKRKHKGGCHCGRVRFEVIAPSQVTAIECSCDSCSKRQSRYFPVPSEHFYLVQGHGELSTFGSEGTKHSFCSTCGVQSFFIPAGGDNDLVGVMPHCLDPGTMKKVKTEKRDTSKSPPPSRAAK